MPSPSTIAFFDVDETLIRVKSMFDFYDFFLESVGHTVEECKTLSEQARSLLRPGLPRERGNTLFYRNFTGRKASDVADIGSRWFDRRLRRGDLFHQDVLTALREHSARGEMTVLVSGSFRACLEPLAEHCGADLLLCTELEVVDGIYTGEVTRSMVGDAKARAAGDLISRLGVDRADCHGYGDHTSDLGLLRLVGHPVAVGANPELIAIADANQWARMAGAAG